NATNGGVYALAASGNTVYAGGYFDSIGGQTRQNISALDATTGAAATWNPGADSTVRALVVSGDVVYAGGQFASAGGQPRSGLAALDKTSGVATSWNPNLAGGNFSPYVNAMVVSGNLIYVGGRFDFVNGQLREHIAAIDRTNSAATDWDPGSTNFVNALAVA